MNPPAGALFATDDPVRTLRAATGCEEIEDAVAWLAEDRRLRPSVSRQRLIGTLTSLDREIPRRDEALQRLVRKVATSELDTAAILFGLTSVTHPRLLRQAIDELARQSPTKTLVGMTPYSVLHAQHANRLVMETLCSLAGLTYRDAQERVGVSLPGSPEGDWSLESVRAVFELASSIIAGHQRDPIDLPGAAPMRPVEHMFAGADGPGGWERLEAYRTGGVPLEVLVAQRQVGGSWVTHRSATSTAPAHALADRLAEELEARGLDYVRASSVGGDASSRDIEKRVGGSRSIGMVVLTPGGRPQAVIAFSVARDGGTARKNAGRLKDLTSARVPVALVLAGPGWKDRNETAELARAFGGGLYTDHDLVTLAEDLAELQKSEPDRRGG